MKSVVLLTVFVLLSALAGCMDHDMSQTVSKEKSVGKNAELALKFLQGAQNSDKKVMYDVTGITEELVKDSTEKLVHQSKYNLSAAQKKTYEDILRTSGQVDYFSGKIRKLFPKSSSFSVINTSETATNNFDHTVAITYKNMADAPSDKQNKAVKVMLVHLIQTNITAEMREVHSFSFDSKGFDRFADKDFEVVTYY
jgi:hypothetical protein